MLSIRWCVFTQRPGARRCSSACVGRRRVGVDGMKEEEGVDFLEELRSFATQSQFTYAHQWRPGDAILWDNRCTMHRATIFPDELGRRLCYRTTTEGGAPY